MITALCGGVGGSKLALGLYRALPPDELNVVVNTADDLEFCGLHVSPDVDTVTYTLAGISQRAFGWGIQDDTFNALEMLERFGVPGWFHVGDRDLATDIYRTEALHSGARLTEVTAHIAASLKVRARILPMTDDRVSTRLLVGDEWLEFQEYFVHRRYRDTPAAIRYEDLDKARPTPEVTEAIAGADVVVIVNSNPVLSIQPILLLPGIKELLRRSRARCVAVSPIVGTDAVSGPAGDLMRLAEQPASATGVAALYRDVLDGMVIDRQDEQQAIGIEALGLAVLTTDTIMRTVDDRVRLAQETVAFGRGL